MSKNAAHNYLWNLFDRASLKTITLSFIGLTIIPAGLYYSLSNFPHFGYIGSSNLPETSFLSALYFSVTTETTLGYGDITPYGWCRLVACIQVIFGLLLGGVTIAKLTSLPERGLRELAHKASGIWIEPCKMPDGRVLVGITEISGTPIGGLRCVGENYSPIGEPLGSWWADLYDYQGSYLRFTYKNSDSSVEYFSEGTMTQRFHENIKTGKWDRHHSTCQDFGLRKTVAYEGFRASPEELVILTSTNIDERRKLIRKYSQRVSDFGPESEQT